MNFNSNETGSLTFDGIRGRLIWRREATEAPCALPLSSLKQFTIARKEIPLRGDPRGKSRRFSGAI